MVEPSGHAINTHAIVAFDIRVRQASTPRTAGSLRRTCSGSLASWNLQERSSLAVLGKLALTTAMPQFLSGTERVQARTRTGSRERQPDHRQPGGHDPVRPAGPAPRAERPPKATPCFSGTGLSLPPSCTHIPDVGAVVTLPSANPDSPVTRTPLPLRRRPSGSVSRDPGCQHAHKSSPLTTKGTACYSVRNRRSCSNISYGTVIALACLSQVGITALSRR